MNAPVYAYQTIDECEEITGFRVSEDFKTGWDAARAVNRKPGAKKAPKGECGNCRYWQNVEGSVGECHRFAPPTTAKEGGPYFNRCAIFAQTASNTWCGDYEPGQDV